MVRYFPLLLFFLCQFAYGQSINENEIWPASWIGPKEGRDFGVYYFSKTVALTTLPDSLVVLTSGDTRYELYVNGQMVTTGPQIGDLSHWYYERTDIIKFLHPGQNTLSAKVWNYGAGMPDALSSVRTAFLLCAADKKWTLFNTNSSWKTIKDNGVRAIPIDKKQISGYFGAGPTQAMHGSQMIWHLDDEVSKTWDNATVITYAQSKFYIWGTLWKLIPMTLPQEERTVSNRWVERSLTDEQKDKKSTGQYLIPPNTETRIVLDNGVLTTGYPNIRLG